MRRMLLSASTAAFCLFAASGIALSQPPIGESSDPSPKRFAFLPQFFVDLHHGTEHDGIAGADYSIRECHKSELNCLDGTLFKLAWPVRCVSIDTGDVYSTNGITTQVIGSFEKPGRHATRNLFLATTEGVDNSLFILSRRSGLIGIINDPGRRSSLKTDAAEPAFQASLGSQTFLRESGYVASYLTGLGNVGTCEKLLRTGR